MKIKKINHVLPPDNWLAYFAVPDEPYYSVHPVSDRALVTAHVPEFDEEGNLSNYRDDEFTSEIVGFVSFGKWVSAEDDALRNMGVVFLGYVHPSASSYLASTFPDTLDPDMRGKNFKELHDNLVKTARGIYAPGEEGISDS